MPRFTVSYATYIVAGHTLQDHPGPCSRPHGHNYTVRVWVERRDRGLDEKNMVIDYYVLRKSVEEVLAKLDHKMLNEVLGTRNPTSELLAAWIAERLSEKIGSEYRIVKVEVFETPDFCAIYTP